MSTILRDEDILALIEAGRLAISPFILDALQPTSYDISIDGEITPSGRNQGFDQITLEPFKMRLFISKESFALPLDVIGHLYMRSSYARKGLAPLQLGRLEAGWSGKVVLEVLNVFEKPVTLSSEERIAQIEFTKLDMPVRQGYSGQFQGYGLEL